ncbi:MULTISPECIES: hypothetical protein [unclassified Streptomyces]|uniref:hypothetical protein n=1 Tax=unclassified Streptomyces TaxID=2593676 RepID=UPI002030A56C|nr:MULTISPECIES: hypothetical protein [unclassified Streptomyces]MCM1969691.1 hypothetical protein [Streptomyces sp. G1]MCX5129757.1 hypothetical protein [Streptomyces sp. NBC_00347]MCX5300559.1 hypothetical protein [Streptomyces sp. NBC_00193]
MSGDFAQEWERERAGATDHDVAVRLNGAPTGPFAPGGSGDFASTPAEKQAAANTIETELEPNTKKASEHADDATSTAQKGFEGWDTAGALKKVSDTWDQQVRTLMGRLSSEKGALRGTSGLFVRNDTGLGNQFLASGSKLNGL